MITNEIRLRVRITNCQEKRYTPAGVLVFEAMGAYDGTVIQAGLERRLTFERPLMAFAEIAQRLFELPNDATIDVIGFITPRSFRNPRLVVHITEFKLRS